MRRLCIERDSLHRYSHAFNVLGHNNIMRSLCRPLALCVRDVRRFLCLYKFIKSVLSSTTV